MHIYTGVVAKRSEEERGEEGGKGGYCRSKAYLVSKVAGSLHERAHERCFKSPTTVSLARHTHSVSLSFSSFYLFSWLSRLSIDDSISGTLGKFKQH